MTFELTSLCFQNLFSVHEGFFSSKIHTKHKTYCRKLCHFSVSSRALNTNFKTMHSKSYTRGQVSVNKRNSVLSNYFDVSFEIYYVRLKYIDSIGQVVKLLILRPASIYCTRSHRLT